LEASLVRPPRATPERDALVPVRITIAALTGVDPKLLVAFQDISEARAREEHLERVEAALGEASWRKDDFLAALSHELRNPLTRIRTGLNVLSRAEPGSDLAHRSLATVERQVVHLARLVDDLLDVTRITKGKIQVHPELVELGGLVQRGLEDHRAS